MIAITSRHDRNAVSAPTAVATPRGKVAAVPSSQVSPADLAAERAS